jgi:hypothetical protein
MVRYLLAGVVGCLYVAGSIWLVQSEGQRYRSVRRAERVAAAKSDKPSPASTDTEIPDITRVTAAEPASARPKPEGEPAPAIQDSMPSANPAGKRAKPASEVASLRPAKTPAGARSTSPPPLPAAKNANAVDQRKDLAGIWDQPALRASWDVAQLTTDDEIRLGRALHELILQFNRPLDTGPWQRRVEEAAEPFQKTVARKDIPYTFTVLDSNAVNAFSHPGGFVYVSRGLFNLIGEDEDYALEFVVGHEIAHVDLQHALKILRDPGVMKLSEGTLQKLYMLIIPFGYLDLDLEADAWVYRRMKQLGRTERETLTFLRKLEGYAKANGFENGRAKPQPGRDASPLDNHFRAHIAAWRRLKHLKELAGKP